MNKSKLLAYALGAWLVVEAIAFVLVVQFLGVTAALLLGLGTTLLGLLDIKRLFLYLRRRAGFPAKKKPEGAPPNVVDGGLQALSCALLILPGFASDLVGLALKAPSIRSDIARRLTKDEKRGPRTIDLKPTEWKSLDQKRPRRKRVTHKASDAPPVR